MKLNTTTGVNSSHRCKMSSFQLIWQKYISLFITSLLLLFSSGYVAAAPPLYRVTDLGDLLGGNSNSIAYGINNLGQVVGSGDLGSASAPNAFLWENGVMTYLGALPGNVERSEAYAINDSGQVVGWSRQGSKASPHAFIWENGIITDLGDLPGGLARARALDINNSGNIVGESSDARQTKATEWDGNVITELLSPNPLSFSGTGSANAINDQGQAVGHAAVGPGGSNQAVLWDNNGNPTNLGTLFPQVNDRSTANDINSLGQIVGSSGNGRSSDIAVLWDNGNIIELGNVPGTNTNTSTAFAINDIGQIVGTGSIGHSTRPFLWQEGDIFDLNNLLDPNDPLSADTLLLEAFDINNSGQIVGRALFQEGDNGRPASHAFLLTPVSAIPVPAAVWLFGSGLLGLIGIARRKVP